FVARGITEGREETVHVKNTGRCKELLTPGARVFLDDFTFKPGKRKLLYDLIAVYKGDLLINMDSYAPNRAAGEALADGRIVLPGMNGRLFIRPETKYGDSRFDFFVRDEDGKEGFVEVKGVTLENDGVVSFPDAPTERGVKHLGELIKAHSEGYACYILFVIQMKGMKYFRPNDETHRAFGDALRNAAGRGVMVLAYECEIARDSMDITTPLEVRLS
ncbi:MAG: DNA/RNA nuclease SfsA, partial [Oscillospiraceae bacterium]|nr:DNA/RNA nuclease SfsA [Oscillospiraceae bacterium]